MQNSKTILLTVIAAIALCFVSCDENDEITPSGDNQIVVEGWIDDGGAPVVMLTSNVNITTEWLREEDLLQLIIDDATVRVVCDGKATELELEYDDQYFPPFIYTTTELKGETGKRYELQIEARGKQLSAVTTIPEAVPVDSFTIGRSRNVDSFYTITGHFSDIPNQKNYYKYLTKVTRTDGTSKSSSYASETFLTPMFNGLMDDVMLGKNTSFPVKRGFINYESRYIEDFLHGDIVTVKFAQIDDVSYAYWNDYQNLIMFSSTMAMNASRKVRSNIKGGLGVWCGYGATYYTITIP